ncbi:MAG: hypothetical protein AB7S26_29990 [Sandaracinaceae bacterium]
MSAPTFQAKGLAFIGAMKAAERAPGGLDAVLSAMPAAERQRVLSFYTAHSWYPLETLIALMETVADRLGVPSRAFVVKQSARAARQDIEGTYRQALRAETPAAMAPRLPRAFNRYFSPCEAELVAQGEGSMTVEVEPIPADRLAFFEAVNEGFVTGALGTLGVARVDFAWSEPVRSPDGTLVLRFVARWDESPGASRSGSPGSGRFSRPNRG